MVGTLRLWIKGNMNDEYRKARLIRHIARVGEVRVLSRVLTLVRVIERQQLRGVIGLG